MATQRDLQVIWFDQDDTLYDYGAAMRRSLAAALTAMRQTLPGGVPGLDVDALIAVREEIADRCDRAGMGLVQTRQESFREALARFAAPDERLADAMSEAYYAVLFTGTRPLPETEPCLRALQPHWTLGVLSNGLPLIEGLGIAHYFRHLLYAGDAEPGKPQIKFFRLAEQTAGARPEQCLLVGDNESVDVVGARDAGWHAVWLNRGGRAWSVGGPPPGHVIASLSELPELLGVLTGDRHRSSATRQ